MRRDEGMKQEGCTLLRVRDPHPLPAPVDAVPRVCETLSARISPVSRVVRGVARCVWRCTHTLTHTDSDTPTASCAAVRHFRGPIRGHGPPVDVT